jgi:hypothetical protein
VTALADLAALVKARRKAEDATGRLILFCGQGAHDRLTAASLDAGHGGSIVPAVPLAEGEGLTYRQVEIYRDPAMPGLAWRLLDGGEIAGEGEL